MLLVEDKHTFVLRSLRRCRVHLDMLNFAQTDGRLVDLERIRQRPCVSIRQTDCATSDMGGSGIADSNLGLLEMLRLCWALWCTERGWRDWKWEVRLKRKAACLATLCEDSSW